MSTARSLRFGYGPTQRAYPCRARYRLFLLGAFLLPAAFLLGAAFLLPRHLRAFLARFGQADRDRLLAALHLLARASALQRAPFALVHRAFHFLLGFLAVLRHSRLPSLE